MTKKKTLIYKEICKRKKYLKNELKQLILKSVCRNFKINEILRVLSFFKIQFLKKKKPISKQNNICQISGKYGGVYK